MRKKIIALLIFTLMIGISADADAVTLPRGRTITGTVSALDSSSHMVMIIVDGDDAAKTPLEVKWSARTIARMNEKPVSFENLRAGTKVTARYVRPLFGPAVLRTITWCETSAESG